eukprot:CAMPEP_0185903230 /NCGR_PEP_ID=MMETSP0196C-20130402/2424_1 /TAXON_ID=2932 /ORGANISM="Alexandrium fundyense, Strain CCMP1719" /LENGTH=51 /DNA_ID=CAMNT_0028622227 /DNA_START=24 /DNA_END=176 /DNA_ORIENTATION=-
MPLKRACSTPDTAIAPRGTREGKEGSGTGLARRTMRSRLSQNGYGLMARGR